MLQSGESGSRTDITLPEPQKQLLHEIKALDKKIVLVLFNGRPLALTDIIEDCDAVLKHGSRAQPVDFPSVTASLVTTILLED